MHTIVHVIYSHRAFDDRVFFKEACSLSKKYRTVILSKTKDGLLHDMGGNIHKDGIYSNVELYAIKDRTKNGLLDRAKRKIARKLKLQKKTNHEALFEKMAELKLHPDVIHVHEPEILGAAAHLKAKYNCKIIFDCHEYHYAYFQREDISSFSTLQETAGKMVNLRRLLTPADAVISVTKTMEAVNWFIFPWLLHETIYNSTLIDKKAKKERSDPIVLVHEGAMSFSRGLKLMIELFDDAWFQNNVRLRIVGELTGKELEYFDASKRKNPIIEKCIEITGWIKYENLSEAILGDIGIIFFEKMPNNYLGMPNKLFNYIGAGIPVLSVPLLEVGRMIESFNCGVVAERNVPALKKGILEIIENYDRYSAGVEKAKEPMSWKADEKKLYALYDALLGE
ncbi:MAG: glycosyltransferase [Rectinemataceae bacterium]